MVPFRNGRLTIEIQALGTDYQLQAPASGSTTGFVDVQRTATTLTSFWLPGGSLSVTGTIVPVTDPLLSPITGVVGTFENLGGGFSSQGGGGFGGVMGLRFPGAPTEPGVVDVCVFFPCASELQPFVPVELAVVGIGGQQTVQDLIDYTIAGAPWTSGTASVPVDGGQAVESGAISVLGDGYIRVRLVTPIAIEIHEPPEDIPSRIAAFGFLRLEIAPVPEPGAGSAGLAAAGALSGLARRRRPTRPQR